MSSSPPDEPGGLRPPRDADFDAILALMNAAQRASFGDDAEVTADELRTWLTTPSIDPARDVRVLEQAGNLVGYVDADLTGSDQRWWSDVNIGPHVDVDDVLPVLIAWLDERAEAGVARVWTGAGDARMLDAYARLGFEPVRHSYRMRIELDEDVAPPAWPAGVQVRTYEPGDERRVYDAHVEIWRDASDPLEESFDDWRHWMTRREGFDPSLWFLAEADGELAGIALCDNVKPAVGWVGILGVRRAWRRKGLGEGLLRHALREFRARGIPRAELGVDASSPTGATRLYERAGMTVYRDTVFLERPIRRELLRVHGSPVVRSATAEDVPAVTELVRAAELAVLGRTKVGADAVVEWWRHVDLPTGSWLFEDDGRPVAFGGLMLRGDAADFWGVVHPDSTGRGLGSALVDRAEGRAQEARARELRIGTHVHNEHATRLLRERGYREARHFFTMRIDFDAPPPEPVWPPGIVGGTMGPGDEQAFHAALMEAFEGEWGWVATPYDEWRALRVDVPDLDRSLFLVARDGDEVAAVARCEARERGGFVGAIGVRPAWRRRGVGLALLRAAFAEFHGRGQTTVRLGVDAENPTGATRLYERAGMHVEFEEVVFARALE